MTIQWRDNQQRYGVLTVVLHWLVAVLIAVLVGLGLWMTRLGVFDPWYQTVPMLHTSLGALVAVLMLVRLLWRARASTPVAPVARSAKEALLGKLVHGVLYGNVLVVIASGYLAATGAGRAIEWFNLVSVPVLIDVSAAQVEWLKTVHAWSVWFLVGLIALHVAAVLKHQLIDKDPMLQRMQPSMRWLARKPKP